MARPPRRRRPPPGFDIWRAGRASPKFFVEQVLGSFAWSKQVALLESVRDNPRTAVRSCHGVGKTKGAAMAALWFLTSYPRSRVITTAPTWAQVEQLLWREIRAEHAQAAMALGGKPSATKLEIDPDWFALGLSTDEPERFQGHHADAILLIADEASGVAPEIFEAGEGYMTEWENARMLLIGNPTQPSGEFYDAFHVNRALWSLLSISSFDSPAFTGENVPPEVLKRLVSKEWVEDKREKWGEDSIMWQVRVLGQFSDIADVTVISLAKVEGAQQRSYEPKVGDACAVSCDVARFGTDETVIATLFGRRLRIAKTYMGKPLTETAGNIINTVRELEAESEQRPKIVVDDDGVGGGVTDILREAGYEVVAFNGGATAIEEDNYPNARSEAWFRFEAELDTLDLDGDEQLAADLTAPEFKLDSKGRRVVERKEDTKKRLGRSPDRGDAALLLLAPGQGIVEYGPSLYD